VKSLFIVGYFGSDNLGDDLLLAALLDRLVPMRLRGIVRLAVLSNSPHLSSKNFTTVLKRDFFGILSELPQTDIIIGCGGSLLQDATSLRSIKYYAGLIRWAKLFGARVALVAQGLGPLTRPASRRLALRTLNAAEYLSFRDATAAQLAAELGVAKSRLAVSADLAFTLDADAHYNPSFERNFFPALHSLPKPAPAGEDLFVVGQVEDRPRFVALCPRPLGDPAKQVGVLTKLADDLTKFPGVRVVLIPFHFEQDTALCEDIHRRCKVKPLFVQDRLSVDNLLSLYRRLDLVVGYRLHSLILACKFGIPAVGLSYDPKVDSFCKAASSPCLPAGSDFAESVVKLAFETMTHPDKAQAALADASAKFAASAKSDIDALLRWVTE